MLREARFGLGLGLAALVAWLCWLSESKQAGSAPPTQQSVLSAQVASLTSRPLAAPHQPRSVRALASPATTPLTTPAQAQPTAPIDDEAAHPHPITPQHEVLRAQQQLVAALNDALDQRDAAGLRALIERYDAVAPEDPQRLAEGYERVADCLDAADPAQRTSARANGQRYYDDARASSLRRYVRRVCLETSADAL